MSDEIEKQPEEQKTPEPKGESIVLELLRIVHNMDSKLENRKHITEDVLSKVESIEKSVCELAKKMEEHISESKRSFFKRWFGN